MGLASTPDAYSICDCMGEGRPGRSCHMNDINVYLGRQRVGRSHGLNEHISLLFMQMLSVLNKFSASRMFSTPVALRKVLRFIGVPPLCLSK